MENNLCTPALFVKMGNSSSNESNTLQDERALYVSVQRFRTENARGFHSNFVVFEFTVRHKRWRWTIIKRYGEVKALHKKLKKDYEDELSNIKLPGSHFRIFGKLSNAELQTRADELAVYFQAIASVPKLFESPEFKMFVEVGQVVFRI